MVQVLINFKCGYIITNSHLICLFNDINVILDDGSKIKDFLIGKSDYLGIDVLKINKKINFLNYSK